MSVGQAHCQSLPQADVQRESTLHAKGTPRCNQQRVLMAPTSAHFYAEPLHILQHRQQIPASLQTSSLIGASTTLTRATMSENDWEDMTSPDSQAIASGSDEEVRRG